MRLALRRTWSLVAVAISVLCAGVLGAGPNEDSVPTISSDGTAKVTRSPDFVEIVFSSLNEASTPGGAHSVVEKEVAAAMKAIRELQLKDLSIQSAEIELEPKYSSYERQESSIIGYRARNTFRVRTSDLTKVVPIADAALAAGCKEIVEITYGINAVIEAREEAIALAVKAAKRKAGVMAGALDVKLGKLLTAQTYSGFGQSRWNRWSRYNQPMAQMSANMSTSDSVPAELGNAYEPGKVEIWAQASVAYAIEQ